MSERYTKLFSLPKNLYAEGSPVIIEAGVLTLDNNTNRVFVQLKFRNISDKEIKALSVTLKAYYVTGKEASEPVKYQYLDFCSSIDEEFGAKTPVLLHDNTVRSFSVHVDEVVYADNTVGEVNLDYSESVPEQHLLCKTDGWNNDTALEFKKLTNDKCVYAVCEYKDLWLCSCGCVNRADKDEKCRSCGVAYDLLKSVTPEKAQESIDEARYNETVETMKNGDLSSYEEAIVIFRSLGDYKDSDEKITECENQIQKINIKNKKNKKIAAIVGAVICAVIGLVAVIENVIIPAAKYNNAVKLYEASKFDEAIDVFTNLDDYKDSADQIKNCKYEKANKLIEAKNYVDACDILADLDDYKDCKDKAFSAKQKMIKNAKTGDTVIFGLYKQENIKWLVLEKNNGRILVISKYILDCKEYNTTYEYATWEVCSLRKWLNNDFFNSAFSEKERALIREVTVSADKNPKYYDVDPGNATQDKLFLLSIPEVNKYFPSDEEKKCNPTEYAKLAGGLLSDADEWWLRTPGFRTSGSGYEAAVASAVRDNGDVWEDGYGVEWRDGVRPAMWITTSEG